MFHLNNRISLQKKNNSRKCKIETRDLRYLLLEPFYVKNVENVFCFFCAKHFRSTKGLYFLPISIDIGNNLVNIVFIISINPYLRNRMTFIDSINEYKLENAPADCIQSVKFGKHSNQFLLAASWDSTVRFYDILNKKLCHKFDHPAPVLDCIFQDANHIWTGGLDKNVRIFDANTGIETIVGSHNGVVRCVEFSHDNNLVITGGWDSNIKLWDGRTPSSIGTYSQPDKVYTFDTCGDTVVVGTAERRVLVWDLKNMSYPQQRRESSLKYQTRYIRCFSNKEGFVLSSIEGRVAVEYLDPNPEIQKKKYAFKCHRNKDAATGSECIYPVNSMSFHSGYNTFATGGSDGFVNIWDGFNKKRLSQFHKYPTSISSLCFSHDGSYLAIASSFLSESNEVKEIPPDSIYIRKVSDQETRPK
ncbi:mitotic checkpoint protein BUB3-like protein [Sarcoptes scabiei]|uniref:Mitotic checkpoint protein BUB3-like protein n=2 Tax=Sarcoptes scabiei TaxID=52283 RepID=A0A132A004_SARSC|nr:mitotic checkpoint protein BUB3-like protein [Sarcoptes scabiei]